METDPCLRYARKNQKAIIELIREFVECESPSDSPSDVNRFVALLSDRVRDIARVKTFDGGAFGKHMRVEFTLPGKKKDGQILALGHSDTVWTLGTLRSYAVLGEEGPVVGSGRAGYEGRVGVFHFRDASAA